MTDQEKMHLAAEVGWVYFIQAGKNGAVKIGWTRQPDRRFRALQTSQHSQLRFLGVIPGDRTLERQLHQRFAVHRMKGEWFKRSGVVGAIMPMILDHGFRVVPARIPPNSPRQNRAASFSVVLSAP